MNVSRGAHLFDGTAMSHQVRHHRIADRIVPQALHALGQSCARFAADKWRLRGADYFSSSLRNVVDKKVPAD